MNAEVIVVHSESTAITIVEYSEIEETLARLREKHKNVVFDVSTAKGDKEARATRQELVKMRTGLDKLRLKLNSEDRARIERRNSEAQRITSSIVELESPIDQQIKAEEQRKEDERAAKIEAEQKRVADLQERVAELRGNQMLTPTSGSVLIAEHIADIEAMEVDDSFQEYREQAQDTKAKGLERLRELRTAAVAYEAEQAELKAERERLAQERVAQGLRNAQLAMIRNNFENRPLECARIGRLDAYDGVIDALETDIVDKADYGDVTEQALTARATALDLLRTARAALAERLEVEATAVAERARLAEETRQLESRREEQETQEKRLADERAALEHEQAALRAAQEPQKPDPPSLPVPTPAAASVSNIPATRWRPKDEAILHLLSTTYNVPRETVVSWVVEMAQRLQSRSAA